MNKLIAFSSILILVLLLVSCSYILPLLPQNAGDATEDGVMTSFTEALVSEPASESSSLDFESEASEAPASEPSLSESSYNEPSTSETELPVAKTEDGFTGSTSSLLEPGTDIPSESPTIETSEPISAKEPFPEAEYDTDITDEFCITLLSELVDYISELGDVSVFYSDINENNYFYINPGRVFKFQSLIKAPYANYIYKISSAADLNSLLTITEDLKRVNGSLYSVPDGSRYTVSELLNYMIVESDNTAYNVLYNHFGASGFNRYMQSLGLAVNVTNGRFTSGTAYDMGKALLDIYSTRNEYSEQLVTDLINSKYAMLISKGAVYNTVAHKYGYGGEYLGLHDMAIIFADPAFVLVILTNLPKNVENSTVPFIQITEAACKINRYLYIKP